MNSVLCVQQSLCHVYILILHSTRDFLYKDGFYRLRIILRILWDLGKAKNLQISKDHQVINNIHSQPSGGKQIISSI